MCSTSQGQGQGLNVI